MGSFLCSITKIKTDGKKHRWIERKGVAGVKIKEKEKEGRGKQVGRGRGTEKERERRKRVSKEGKKYSPHR